MLASLQAYTFSMFLIGSDKALDVTPLHWIWLKVHFIH
ncbi:hypothetical protein BLL69_0144c [Lacticaseibacillus paracasei]|nr:hypothetical protein BLL69_0144c [Lacticaseibacillus paracasei]